MEWKVAGIEVRYDADKGEVFIQGEKRKPMEVFQACSLLRSLYNYMRRTKDTEEETKVLRELNLRDLHPKLRERGKLK